MTRTENEKMRRQLLGIIRLFAHEVFCTLAFLAYMLSFIFMGFWISTDEFLIEAAAGMLMFLAYGLMSSAAAYFLKEEE